MRIYRVQDKDGRGPFKPGFSNKWSDETFAPGQKQLPTWMQEFNYTAEKINALDKEAYYGSGVKSIEDIKKWFSETERAKLKELGYFIVSLSAVHPLNESENQVFFSRAIPLNAAKHVIPWEKLDKGYEIFEGKLCKVINGDRSGWWRFHDHYDRDGYCDNPGRGY